MEVSQDGNPGGIDHSDFDLHETAAKLFCREQKDVSAFNCAVIFVSRFQGLDYS